jgi:pyruvate dehydrogenase E2 component (dihydrolipoamide acetyltransferase)/2-oxoglutarate dehydrogenase E2 component (dihydrolipoamide succinyltransferase)
MPKLAMGQTEGTVVEWLAKEGDWVEKGQQVMVVETEKVAYETEAPASGFFHRVIELNVTVPVLETVALLAETEEELADLQASAPDSAAEPASVEVAAPVPAPAEVAAEAVPAAMPAARAETEAALPVPGGPARTRSGKIKISPVARKYARHHDLDISLLTGSGPGGRIVKRDVDQALAEREAAPVAPALAWTGEVVAGKRVKATLPLKGMRRAIAEHMQHSLAASAQLTFMGEIDMTEMIRLRKTLLQKEEELGLRLTFTDLFVYVLIRAIQHVPIVNASLLGDEIKIWEDINIGIAVALELNEYETGLIVPVVKNADRLTLTEIGRTIRDLTARARDGRLVPGEASGGTITLSNAGAFYSGWAMTTPILNQPEVALVQPGGIFDKPVVRDGQVVVRPIMTLCITYDHRVLDGIPMTRFYNKIKELLENPAFLHL